MWGIPQAMPSRSPHLRTSLLELQGLGRELHGAIGT